MPRKKEVPSMEDIFDKKDEVTKEVVEEVKEERVTMPSGFDVARGSYDNFIKLIENGAKQELNAITPIGFLGDKPVYDMQNYVEAEKISAKAREHGANVGNLMTIAKYDDNGNLLRVPRDKYVVIENIEFANRVRKNDKKKTVSVVVDYLPVSEHSSGRISQSTITSYEIGKRDRELTVLSVENVTSHDFVQEFVDEFQGDYARIVKEIISHYQTKGTNEGLDLNDLFG